MAPVLPEWAYGHWKSRDVYEHQRDVLDDLEGYEANGLRRTVLPAAEEAFGYAREGYREGKFSFLEVLDAQRTLFETRGLYRARL